jgi:hypothetical protein
MSLSRDSGLTMSDSQLYTPDEEESGSTSSGSGRALYPPTQQPSCYDIHTHTKVSLFFGLGAQNDSVFHLWRHLAGMFHQTVPALRVLKICSNQNY